LCWRYRCLAVLPLQFSVNSHDLPPLRRIFFSMIDCTARLLRITIQAEYDKGSQPASQSFQPQSFESGAPATLPSAKTSLYWTSPALGVSRPALHDKVRTSHPLHSSFTPLRHTNQTPLTPRLADLSLASLACIICCMTILPRHDVSPAARILRPQQPP
jgi:hypothetical protein